MLQTYEAVLEPNGHLQFLEMPPMPATVRCRVLVTFQDELPATDTALCGARLSETALAKDWQREEEDAAWAHMQTAR
jgi:hypothetical protein